MTGSAIVECRTCILPSYWCADVELAELGDDDDAFIRRTSDEDEEALIAEGPSSAATQRRTGRKICIAGTCTVVVLVLAVGTFLAYKFVLPKLHLGQSSSDLIQSPNDPRNYKALTLSNGLQVLLISSQAAVSGAAALDVHVGSWSDPPKIPGLAHFLEHMVWHRPLFATPLTSIRALDALE
jgi:hypothetical protein